MWKTVQFVYLELQMELLMWKAIYVQCCYRAPPQHHLQGQLGGDGTDRGGYKSCRIKCRGFKWTGVQDQGRDLGGRPR